MPSDQHAGVGTGQHTSSDAPIEGRLRSTGAAPVVLRGTVPRPRLVDRLDLGVQRPLTLISAPAGFGKSMLVESWAAQYRGPAMVRRVSLDAGSEPADVLDRVREGPHRSGRQVLVLVVDCGDLTITPELGQSLHRIIRGDAGRVRVVLVTRSDPPLPLHRYRLADTIAEIHASELAFTVDETTALMRTFKLELTDSQVAEIHARTDGWPVGLMFAAMNLAGKSDRERVIREFRGDTGNVAAYLMTEVLDAQPSELRKFLLRTSLVDVVRPGLAEALTGRPCDLRSLQFLSHGNSFIQPLPGTTDCYSYQALFREFLRAELLFEMPTVATALHRDAAAWFARNGQPLEAIHHAVTAGDWSHAAQYLVADLDCTALLAGRGSRQLASLFAEFPDDLDGPEAAVVRAALALSAYEVDRCALELAKARTWLDHEVSARSQSVELAVSVLEAVCASLGGNTETGLSVVLAAETRLRAASADSVMAHPEAMLLVIGCKGRAMLRHGDFPAALEAFTAGAAIAEDSGAHEAMAEFLGMAALVEAIRGRLRRAGEVVAQATALAESQTQPDLPQATIVAEAWMRTDQGDLPSAEHLVQRAAEAAAPIHDTRVVAAALALVRARLLRASGDLDLAAAELRAARSTFSSYGGWLGQALAVDQAKLLVTQHQPQEAIRVIEQSDGRDQPESILVLQSAAAEAGVRPPTQSHVTTDRTAPLDTQVDSWLVEAAESLRAGNAARGGLCLERALRLAAPEQLRRPFAEAPLPLRRMLQPSGELVRQHAWLRGPSDRGRGRAADRWGMPRSELVITSSLTSKEQEVLEYLAELLTTEEIAGTMYVSVNTVRSHVRSILRKLGASRRNEAVRRAWELGLLPSRPDT